MAKHLQPQTEKLSITLPADVVRELRELVEKGKVSAFLAEALRIHLARYRQRQGLEAGYGAWKAEDHPDLLTPEATVQYVDRLRKLDEERIRSLIEGDG
ncbi:MAG: hypothetical protein ACE5JP_07740 [Candidatus Bipolaricaulia bacterium]